MAQCWISTNSFCLTGETQRPFWILNSQNLSSGLQKALFPIGPVNPDCRWWFSCHGHFLDTPLLWTPPCDSCSSYSKVRLFLGYPGFAATHIWGSVLIGATCEPKVSGIKTFPRTKPQKFGETLSLWTEMDKGICATLLYPVSAGESRKPSLLSLQETLMATGLYLTLQFLSVVGYDSFTDLYTAHTLPWMYVCMCIYIFKFYRKKF